MCTICMFLNAARRRQITRVQIRDDDACEPAQVEVIKPTQPLHAAPVKLMKKHTFSFRRQQAHELGALASNINYNNAELKSSMHPDPKEPTPTENTEHTVQNVVVNDAQPINMVVNDAQLASNDGAHEVRASVDKAIVPLQDFISVDAVPASVTPLAGKHACTPQAMHTQSELDDIEQNEKQSNQSQPLQDFIGLEAPNSAIPVASTPEQVPFATALAQYHFSFAEGSEQSEESDTDGFGHHLPRCCKSNNPGGRHGAGFHDAYASKQFIHDAMSFEHPCNTRGPPCCGIYVASDDRVASNNKYRLIFNSIELIRLEYKGEKKSQLVLDKLWAIPDKSPTARQWFVGGRAVCHKCYCAAAGLLTLPNRDRPTNDWTAAVHAFKKELRYIPSRRKHAVQTKVSNKDTLGWAALGWLVTWCDPKQHNVQQLATESDDNVVHVQAVSRAQLHEMFCQSMGTPSQGPKKAISYTNFCRMVRQMNRTVELPTLIFHKWKSQQECARCSALKALLSKARRRKDTRTVVHLECKLKEHLTRARWERIAYQIRIGAGSVLASSWSIGMDGYDSYKSAWATLNGKPIKDLKGMQGMSEARQVKYKTTGVLVHGYGYHLYVADPSLSANANFNVDCLHRTLRKMFDVLLDPNDPTLTEHPSELYVQVDGGSDNKARAFFAYCEWLVKTRVFDTVYVCFLLVGHTHADYDQKFVPITFQLRQSCVKNIRDLMNVYQAAYKSANASPKCIEHVKAVPDYFKWFKAAWQTFQGFARKVPDEDRPHQFVWNADGMWYKNFQTDKTPWNTDAVNILKQVPTDDAPMQVPQRNHLKKLANDREGVFKHFCTNTTANQYVLFTDEDKQEMTDLFDMFCDENGKLFEDLTMMSEKMRESYEWKPLPSKVHMTTEAAEFEHKRGVEPIVHSKLTKKARERLLLLQDSHWTQAQKEAAAMVDNIELDASDESNCEEDQDSAPDDVPLGKRLNEEVDLNTYLARRSKVISKTQKAVEESIIRDMQRTTRRSMNASMQNKDSLTPSQIIDVAHCVGAAKFPGREVLFLMHWVDWKGHDEEFMWQTFDEIGNLDSLDDSLVGEKVMRMYVACVYLPFLTLHSQVVVTWSGSQHNGAVYKGVISEFHGGKKSKTYRIDYEDEQDAELFDFKTFKVDAVDDFPKPLFKRQTWILDSCDWEENKVMDKLAKALGVDYKFVQSTTEGSHDDVESTDEHVHVATQAPTTGTQRRSRVRKAVESYDPSTHGANDAKRRKKADGSKPTPKPKATKKKASRK